MYLSNALLEEEERTKALRVLQETSGFKSRSYLNRARWIGAQLPGMRGLVPRYTHIRYRVVPRYTHIRYRGLDAEGKPVDRKADGFHARVVQHECDHLDGILYPDRIENRRMFGFIEELQAAGLLGSHSTADGIDFSGPRIVSD